MSVWSRMAAEARRSWRLVLVGPLVIAATVNGFLLGQGFELLALAGVFVLSAMIVLLMLGVEALVTAREGEARELSRRLAAAEAEIGIHREKARQLDRIVAMVHDQNEDLRQRLRAGLVQQQQPLVRRTEGNVAWLSDWRRIPEPLPVTGTQN